VCAESIEKFVRTALPGGNANSAAGQGSLSAGGSLGSSAAKVSRPSKDKKKKSNR
jgi:hypothetical protein